MSQEGAPLSSINRNFVGFIKEIFTDAGQYVVHYDATIGQQRPLSLDERAILLACAMTIDIDYFSRHSQHSDGIVPVGMMTTGGGVPAPAPSAGGAGMPMPMPMPGDFGGSTSSSDSISQDSAEPDGPAAPSEGSAPGKNQWGDDEFLTDEQTGVSSDEDGSSLFKDAWDIFTKDD